MEGSEGAHKGGTFVKWGWKILVYLLRLGDLHAERWLVRAGLAFLAYFAAHKLWEVKADSYGSLLVVSTIHQNWIGGTALMLLVLFSSVHYTAKLAV